jgi:hypothetical protein
VDAERRLIILFIGFAAIFALIIMAVAAFIRRDVPDVVATITTSGLALLAPSPLSKSTTPPDPSAPPSPPPPAA